VAKNIQGASAVIARFFFFFSAALFKNAQEGRKKEKGSDYLKFFPRERRFFEWARDAGCSMASV